MPKMKYAIIQCMQIGLNAHLLSHQAGYRAAGIHSYIYNLLRHLPAIAPANWRFRAMVGGANPAVFDGITMCRARFDTQSPARRILWEQTCQAAQLKQFDLYHALAFAAPLWLTAPMIVTVYDLSFIRYPAGLTRARRLYLRMLTALTCRRAKRVLAISQSAADDLNHLLDIPADKIDVTPLGYDQETFRPLPAAEIDAFRRQHSLPPRFWLFVGTLEPRKNLHMLLNAYARLPSSARLPLILGGGKGWLADSIFAAIEQQSLGDEVRHIGFIPAADLPRWYNSAEAFLYPSVFEGFGLPALEAMACGTPVLTSNVSSLPEVVGAAGLTLPPGDSVVWADALQDIMTNRGWRTAAREQGLERARLFSWQRTAELTVASYRHAIADIKTT